MSALSRRSADHAPRAHAPRAQAPLPAVEAGNAARQQALAGGAQETADAGVSGGGESLPFLDQIQAAFGKHDVSGVGAHVGGDAAGACEALGANAFATGDQVAFAGAPSLHTAAHEAAHVVQQRQGVQLEGGLGQSGDSYEQHADRVADKVVAGESAEGLLDGFGGGGGTGVQREAKPGAPTGKITPSGLNLEHENRSLTVGTDKLSMGHKLWELPKVETFPIPLCAGLNLTFSLTGEAVATNEGSFVDGAASVECKASITGNANLNLGFKYMKATASAGLELGVSGKATVRPRGGADLDISGGLKGKLGASISVFNILDIPFEGPTLELIVLAGMKVRSGRLVELGEPRLGGDLKTFAEAMERLKDRAEDYVKKPWTLIEDLNWLYSLGADISDDALAAAKKAYDGMVLETQEGISAVAGATGLGPDVYKRRKEIQAEIEERNGDEAGWGELARPLRALRGCYDPEYYNAAYRMFKDKGSDEPNMQLLVLAAQQFQKNWPRHEALNWTYTRPTDPDRIADFEAEKQRFRVLWRAAAGAPYAAVKVKPQHRYGEVAAMEEEVLMGFNTGDLEYQLRKNIEVASDERLLEMLDEWMKIPALAGNTTIFMANEKRHDLAVVRESMVYIAGYVTKVRPYGRVEWEYRNMM